MLFEARAQTPLARGYRLGSSRGPFPDSVPIVVDTFPRQFLERSLGWDIGLAVNIDDRWALGATVGFETSRDSHRESAALYIRRRLTEDFSVDLAPGVFRLIRGGSFPLHDYRGYIPEPVGYNLATRLHLWDTAVLALRYERLHVLEALLLPAASPRIDPGGVEHLLSAGMGMENLVGGFAGTVVALLVAMVINIGEIAG